MFGCLVKSVQRGSIDLLNSLGFHFLIFLFFLRFFHAGDFAHKRGIEFFDGRSVDFVFMKFFILIKSSIDVFVIEVLKLFLIGLSFEFMFRFALVVAELRSLSERATGGLWRLLLDLLNGGVINGLVVKAEVFFESDAFVIYLGDSLGFGSGPVAR